MDDQNNFHHDHTHQDHGNAQNHNSENFGNHSEGVLNHSEEQQNPSDTFGNHSEDIQNGSERVQKVSENQPNHSEVDRESFGKQNNISERTPDHTLSVREVARLFEEAGAPRTERSIINWCNPNKRGIRRLDCYFDEADRKYFVTPQSVQQVIQEERKKQQFTDFRFQNVSEQQPGQFGKTAESIPNPSESIPNDSDTVPKASETIRQDSEPLRNNSESFRKEEENNHNELGQSPDDKRRLKELEHELNDLRITNKAKDFFIERMQEQSEKERQTYIDERKLLIEQLTTSSRKIGELETRLLQIEAPKREPIDVSENERSSTENSDERGHRDQTEYHHVRENQWHN